MEKKSYPLGSKENFEIIQWVLDPKVIDGALRSAIHAHGPITLGERRIKIIEVDAAGEEITSEISTCSTSSASKRIRGAIRTRVQEYIKKNQKPQLTWQHKVREWFRYAPFGKWE